jgi:F0F1-type ATP synthase membrane subunit c/vacuolar-type H+-ATPase subunit K
MDTALTARASRVAQYVAALLGSGGMVLSVALLLLPASRAARCVVQWPETLAEAAWGQGIAGGSLLLLLYAHNRRSQGKFSGTEYIACAIMGAGSLLLLPIALLLTTATTEQGEAARATCGLTTGTAFAIVMVSFYPTLVGLVAVAISRIRGAPSWARLGIPVVMLVSLWWISSDVINRFSPA